MLEAIRLPQYRARDDERWQVQSNTKLHRQTPARDFLEHSVGIESRMAIRRVYHTHLYMAKALWRRLYLVFVRLWFVAHILSPTHSNMRSLKKRSYCCLETKCKFQCQLQFLFIQCSRGFRRLLRFDDTHRIDRFHQSIIIVPILTLAGNWTTSRQKHASCEFNRPKTGWIIRFLRPANCPWLLGIPQKLVGL